MALIPKKCTVGFFNDPATLIEAAQKATDRGFRGCDAYSPYPVHGLEAALNIRRSWIPAVVLGVQAVGALLGWALQHWTHVIDWPINVGGKPLNAFPAYVVIIFESSVLLAGLANFLLLMVACRLFPNPFPKVLDESLTNDRFALLIPFKSETDEQQATNLLKQMGADEIRRIDK